MRKADLVLCCSAIWSLESCNFCEGFDAGFYAYLVGTLHVVEVHLELQTRLKM